MTKVYMARNPSDPWSDREALGKGISIASRHDVVGDGRLLEDLNENWDVPATI
jgi:hypothetical protein